METNQRSSEIPRFSLEIENFRSIQKQHLEIAPMTIVYGPNAAGKSSLLYALLTLKNIILNPNQAPAGFFNYAFASLGSFEAVVFNHNKRNKIKIGIVIETNGHNISYRIGVGEQDGFFSLSYSNGPKIEIELPVSYPYPANQQKQDVISQENSLFNVTWNGILVQVQPQAPSPENQQEAQRISATLNSPIELLRRIGVVPLKRGFSKPHFQSVPISPMVISEDEVATLLSADKYLVQKVSFYLEKILDRDFRVNFTPGTAIFSLDSTDRKTGVGSELVNDGFGINQVVYFLARCLHSDTHIICAEEPEIHLHPSAVRRLAKVLAQIAHDEQKVFLISTHSDSFLTAILALVVKSEFKVTDLACYYARKERKVTSFEHQEVTERGQIKGGLASFIEGEMEDTKAFLGIEKKE